MPGPRLGRAHAAASLAALLLAGCEPGATMTPGPAVWSEATPLPLGADRARPLELIAGGSELFLLTQLTTGASNEPRTSTGDRLAVLTRGVGPWSAPVIVAGLPADHFLSGGIDRDGAGGLHVVWSLARHHGSPFEWDYLAQHRRRDAGSWSPPELLHETTGGAGPPPIAAGVFAGGDGRVHLLYEATDVVYNATRGTVARFLEQQAGGWSEQEVRVGSGAFFGVDAARVGATDLSATYRDYSTPTTIWVLHRRGGVWGAPVAALQVAQQSGVPRLAVESGGRMHLVWSDAGTLRHTTSQDGAAWSAPSTLAPPGGSWGADLRVLRDQHDRLHLLHGNVYRRFADGEWSASVNVVSEAAIGGAAITDDGHLHAVWVRGDGVLLHATLDVSR